MAAPEQLPRMIAMLVLGDAAGVTEERGWLVAFDIEARNGRGDFLFSNDPLEAYTWPTMDAALADYVRQSSMVPLRDDGMPNRPLRGFTVQFVELDATIVRRRLARQKES